jgi:peptidoglycan/LPS O-acetylase OafA/YrhL
LTKPSIHLDWVVRLRGVAALWVMAYHLWIVWGRDEFKFGLPGDFSFGLRSLFRAGYQGIDLFFVLSGFVIAWPYVVSGVNRLSLPEVVDFYQRRYLRIAPAYYASLAVAVTLASFGMLEASTDPWVVVAHVFFVEDFSPEMTTAIRGVYWTLPTEMSFYLLFPLLLRWVSLQRPLWFALATVAFAIGYRAFTLWAGEHDMWLTWTSGTLLGRIEQFGLGMAAACAVVNSLSRSRQVTAPVMLGLTLIAILVAVGVGRAAGPALDWTYLVGPTVLAIAIAAMLYGMGMYFAAAPEGLASRILGAGLLYRIGLASLSLYLWHTFFIDLASNATEYWNLELGTRNLFIFAAALAAIAFSFASYRFIEEPFIAFSKRPDWRRRIIGATWAKEQ